jgi:hypothetical protein
VKTPKCKWCLEPSQFDGSHNADVGGAAFEGIAILQNGRIGIVYEVCERHHGIVFEREFYPYGSYARRLGEADRISFYQIGFVCQIKLRLSAGMSLQWTAYFIS